MKKPQDLTMLAGQTATFHCSVGGDPPPKILWKKEEGNIPVSRVSIQPDDKGLEIFNIVPEDEGTYVCEALNSVGQISARASLTVHGKLNGGWPSSTSLLINVLLSFFFSFQHHPPLLSSPKTKKSA